VSDTSSVYRTVVVGTDGSDSSLRAVERAGVLAGSCGATLVVGSHPAEGTVRTAAERAAAAGVKDVRTVAVQGSPVETLVEVVRREKADLLVVGNRGLAGIEGRLLGSVPADATRRSECDVLVVHTTD
jgi:nucleotide-binding universal stress UspA family protein